MEENPVTYTLQIENDSKGKTRLLNRNLLLLCNSLWFGLKLRESVKHEAKVRGKGQWYGKFTKEQETKLRSNESDLEGIQISPARMKTLEENTLKGKQDSNVCGNHILK